jgi:hypothetical protein
VFEAIMWILLAAAALAQGRPGPASARTEQPTASAPPVVIEQRGGGKVSYWLESSLRRVFPATPPGAATRELLAARNGRASLQACVRNDRVRPLDLECTVSGGDDLKPLVRWVGIVPVRHRTPETAPGEAEDRAYIPGMVPDPLMPQTRATVGPFESRSFWITLNIPAEARPGVHKLTVRLAPKNGGEPVDLPISVEVSELVIKPRQNFPVIHWWRGEATWEHYKTAMFDDRWWTLTERQLADMLDHGSDVVYVPVLFDRREVFKRPCQLLVVDEPKPGVYKFDWSRVKRFTDLARRIGFRRFEWSHLWIYWGVEHGMRVYKKEGDRYVLLWPEDTGATSETYLNFLRQFLPDFHKVLLAEGLLDGSYFHLSDEPGSDKHVENYRKARRVLRELAPWMKVMDALSDVRYGKEGLTDIPIPLVSAAQAYIDAEIPHWVYYCCFPQGPWLNRFMDTPLAKVRMSGWLFYRLGAGGFLHWGFNYWQRVGSEEPLDPFFHGDSGEWPGIPYGDPFVIYPGPEGPIDSIRWEVFAESLQDYAILQSAGIQRGDPLLAPLKSYADYPKDEEWLRHSLARILRKSPDAGGR